MPKRYPAELKLGMFFEERRELQQEATKRNMTMADLIRHSVNKYCGGQVLLPRAKETK